MFVQCFCLYMGGVGRVNNVQIRFVYFQNTHTQTTHKLFFGGNLKL